jgi:hypothetical protein
MIVLLAVVSGAGPAHAQNLNDMVRGLNNVLNPNDARRLEEQAYQNGRSDEQRYWHDYGAGLASSNRTRRDYGPDPRDINGAMAAAVATVTGTKMVTEPTVAPGPTIPAPDIIVSSFGKAAVLQKAGLDRRIGEEGAGPRPSGQCDLGPCLRNFDFKLS